MSDPERANEIALILTARERDRSNALVRADKEQLSALFADDLIHVHTTGIVHDKAQLIDYAISVVQFIEVERSDLLVRSLGSDAAVMTGRLTNRMKRRDQDQIVVANSFVTQIWVREREAWRLARFHGTRLPDAA